MTGRRAVAFATLLCALAFAAVAAPGAMAQKETTAYTCKPEPKPTSESKGFTDEHCTKAGGGELVSFIHEKLEPEKVTKLSASNNETGSTTVPSKFKVTLGGVEFELEATAFTSCAKAAIYNSESGGFHAAGGACGEFTNVTVKEPAGKCEVLGKAIKLNEKGLFATEVIEVGGVEEEMYVLFAPPAGEVFATFN